MRQLLITAALLLLPLLTLAQSKADYDYHRQFNGLRVNKINVTTTQIKPRIVKEKFLLREGDAFEYHAFDYARHALHDMKIFKEINFDVKKSGGGVEINIDAKDGAYIFPLAFAMSSGGNTTFAAALLEANKFKHGELGALFGAFNSDGYVLSGSMILADNSFSVMYGDFDYTQKRFRNGSYNNTGLFGSDDDDDDGLIGQYEMKKQFASFTYGRTFGERAALSLGYIYNDIKYEAKSAFPTPQDAGNHSSVLASASYYKNVKPSKGMAGAFGSVFGLGTSNIEAKIANLPYIKPGYFASLSYQNGGAHTGADYTVSALSATLLGNIEFKTRHTVTAQINAAQNFEGGFSDSVSSKDLMTGKGKYSRIFRADKGWGGGLYGQVYLMKNKTGLLIFEPFVETAYLWDSAQRYNHTGTGASLYVTFWRFQFPLGINYTADTVNGAQTVSFMFGGAF